MMRRSAAFVLLIVGVLASIDRTDAMVKPIPTNKGAYVSFFV